MKPSTAAVLAGLLVAPLGARAQEPGGLAWNHRGWESLDQGRSAEAKRFFEKALDRAAARVTQAEAHLGLALLALRADRPKEALEFLRSAAMDGPYAVAAADQLAGEAASRMGDRAKAATYFRQALDVDPANLEVLRGLMRVSAKLKNRREAWQAAERLLAFDPDDEEALRVRRRDAHVFASDPAAAAGVRRLTSPFLDPQGPPPPASALVVKLGLYGAPDGRPALLTRASLAPNAGFKVQSLEGMELREGKSGQSWSLEYRAEEGGVEARDSYHDLVFSSTSPFRLVVDAVSGSILVRDAAPTAPRGVDLGDRETRGAVDVIPEPGGFRLIAETPLEPYLYGVVSMALPQGGPADAFKAEAVVARSAAVWAAAHRTAGANWDLLDDGSLQRTLGVSGELKEAVQAVDATAGQALMREGAPIRAAQHEDSGGLTVNGLEDAAQPFAVPRSTEDFERFARQAPDGLYTNPQNPAAARWIRLLDARELGERAARARDIGRLRDVRVGERSSGGHVLSLVAEGSRGSLSLTGFKEIQSFLSPGSLRSTLFALQPLHDGRSLSRLLVWGAGTGSGEGLSRAGLCARVRAGIPWREALLTYFPGAELGSLDSSAKK